MPRSRAVILAVVMVTAHACAGFAQQVFSGNALPDRVSALMVGDRLENVAWHLGVAPEAMSVSDDLWPLGRVLANTFSMILNCPNYIAVKDPAILRRTLGPLATEAGT